MTDDTAILGLRRMTLREQAIETLRRAITSGELAPGSHVSEIEMAGRLEISRGTLREAMRTLQNEGLLTATSRGRLLVRQIPTASCAICSTSARPSNRSPPARWRPPPISMPSSRSSGQPWTRWRRRAVLPGRAGCTRDMDFHLLMCRLTATRP